MCGGDVGDVGGAYADIWALVYLGCLLEALPRPVSPARDGRMDIRNGVLSAPTSRVSKALYIAITVASSVSIIIMHTLFDFFVFPISR